MNKATIGVSSRAQCSLVVVVDAHQGNREPSRYGSSLSSQSSWWRCPCHKPVSAGKHYAVGATSSSFVARRVEETRCTVDFPWLYPPFPASVAVGMPIARHPPHRPVLARLTHTVLTSDAWRQSVRWDTGAGYRLPVAGLRVALGSVPRSSGFVGCVDVSAATTDEARVSGIAPDSSRCQEQHDIGNIPTPPTVAIWPFPSADHAFVVAVRH